MQVFHQTENERELLKVFDTLCFPFPAAHICPCTENSILKDILLNIFMSEIDLKLNVIVELFEIIVHPG